MTLIAPTRGSAPARRGGDRRGADCGGASARIASMLGGAGPRRETAICLALSASLHLATLAAFAMVAPEGETSGGAGGTIAVTLVGSDAQLAALTEAWAPPDPALTPIPIAAAEAPAPSRPDPVRPPAQTPPRLATRLSTETPRPPPVAPSEVAQPPAVSQPGPRPRPADLRPATLATAGAPARAAPQAQARQTTRAAGTGGAREAGPQRSAEVATGAAQMQASAMMTWGAQIQRALQRGLAVPRGMARATRDARIVLALSVAPDGRLRAAEVLRSSGDAGLDADALRSVRRIGRLPRAPGGMTDPAYAFTAPIDLRAP